MGKKTKILLIVAAILLFAAAINILRGRGTSISNNWANGNRRGSATSSHTEAKSGPHTDGSKSRHGGGFTRGGTPSRPPSSSATAYGDDGTNETDLASAKALLPGNAVNRKLRDAREPAIFDKLRKSKDRPVSEKVRKLASEVTEGATNDVGKARAIYDWITSNIVYDTVEWDHITSGADEYTHDHDPDSVLERGTTVCIGYAWLFDDMCEAAGVDATWLIGDVRGYRGTPDEELISKFRHAWNAVKLDDGEWHLLDATWGAAQEDEAPSAAKERTDYYFDTPAGQFVYDHLPESDEWQLLEEPIESQTAFSELPNLKPSFFENGLELGAAYTSELKARSGETSALFVSVPDGVETLATLIPGGGDEIKVRTVRLPDGNGIAAVLPSLKSGEYILRLYSGKAMSKTLSCSADFKIYAE